MKNTNIRTYSCPLFLHKSHKLISEYSEVAYIDTSMAKDIEQPLFCLKNSSDCHTVEDWRRWWHTFKKWFIYQLQSIVLSHIMHHLNACQEKESQTDESLLKMPLLAHSHLILMILKQVSYDSKYEILFWIYGRSGYFIFWEVCWIGDCSYYSAVILLSYCFTLLGKSL